MHLLVKLAFQTLNFNYFHFKVKLYFYFYFTKLILTGINWCKRRISGSLMQPDRQVLLPNISERR